MNRDQQRCVSPTFALCPMSVIPQESPWITGMRSHLDVEFHHSNLKGRWLKLLPISARLSTLFLTFLLTMGANCGQAPTELCLNGNPCDDAWLSYVAVSPSDGAEGVSSGSSVRLDFNRSYQRFNSSFASWSSENGAVLFATEESEDKRSVILTPSSRTYTQH